MGRWSWRRASVVDSALASGSARPPPPPPPPQALRPKAITSAHAPLPNSPVFHLHSPLKPLKYHGFPTSLWFTNPFNLLKTANGARPASRLWTRRFAHIRDWIFDLDNCLYPARQRPVRADRRADDRLYRAAARLRSGRGAAGAEDALPRLRHHARRPDEASRCRSAPLHGRRPRHPARPRRRATTAWSRALRPPAGPQVRPHQRQRRLCLEGARPARRRRRHRPSPRHLRRRPDAEARASRLSQAAASSSASSRHRRSWSTTWSGTSRRPRRWA